MKIRIRDHLGACDESTGEIYEGATIIFGPPDAEKDSGR